MILNFEQIYTSKVSIEKETSIISNKSIKILPSIEEATRGDILEIGKGSQHEPITEK